MDYVRLGYTGLKVSRLCLGAMTYGTSKWRAWVLDEADSRPFIARALDHGITFFDTADMYSEGESERVLGRALKELRRRHQVVIATKAFYPLSDDPNAKGLSRKHLMHAIDDSLQRLGTDYVDLYQIHRFDTATPIEETVEALHDIVKAGKARYVGASSMYAWQFAKMLHAADRHGWTRFVTMQNHYNLIYREEEREMLPFCHDQGIGVIPWSPLARGFLAGNRRRADRGETVRAKTDEFAHEMYYDDSDFAVADRAAQIAGRRGVQPAQIGLVRVVPVVVFSMISGVVADAWDRRRLMLFTQTAATLVALALASIAFSGVTGVWLIYVLAALGSAVGAFDLPARNALVPTLVPREHLPNAISLNTIMFQTASVVGPSLGGLLIAATHVGWAYVANAISFAFVIVALRLMRDIPERQPSAPGARDGTLCHAGLDASRHR